MAQQGGTPAVSPGVTAAREARWLGAGYADITKLRELSAKHERQATHAQSKAARLATKIEKFRHAAALLREKAQLILGKIPEIEQEMAQHERDIKAHTSHTGGRSIGSDVTELHYRIRKLQQRIVDVQHKARTLEHKAAIRTQKAAELKIKLDRLMEHAKIDQSEADQYRQRADRLQLATERDLAASAPPPATVPTEEPIAPPVATPEPPDEL
jgi:predicted ribosome quality control (RQC) complex YloA/Tae2 family protein